MSKRRAEKQITKDDRGDDEDEEIEQQNIIDPNAPKTGLKVIRKRGGNAPLPEDEGLKTSVLNWDFGVAPLEEQKPVILAKPVDAPTNPPKQAPSPIKPATGGSAETTNFVAPSSTPELATTFPASFSFGNVANAAPAATTATTSTFSSSFSFGIKSSPAENKQETADDDKSKDKSAAAANERSQSNLATSYPAAFSFGVGSPATTTKEETKEETKDASRPTPAPSPASSPLIPSLATSQQKDTSKDSSKEPSPAKPLSGSIFDSSFSFSSIPVTKSNAEPSSSTASTSPFKFSFGAFTGFGTASSGKDTEQKPAEKESTRTESSSLATSLFGNTLAFKWGSSSSGETPATATAAAAGAATAPGNETTTANAPKPTFDWGPSLPLFTASKFSTGFGESKSDDEDPGEPEPDIPSVPTNTGEENEYCVHSLRAKLFEFDSGTKSWKERGVGSLHLNLSNEEKNKARIVLRVDSTHRLILNTAVFSGMICKPESTDPTSVRITAPDVDGGVVKLFLLRFNNKGTKKEDAANFVKFVKKHLPTTEETKTENNKKENSAQDPPDSGAKKSESETTKNQQNGSSTHN